MAMTTTTQTVVVVEINLLGLMNKIEASQSHRHWKNVCWLINGKEETLTKKQQAIFHSWSMDQIVNDCQVHFAPISIPASIKTKKPNNVIFLSTFGKQLMSIPNITISQILQIIKYWPTYRDLWKAWTAETKENESKLLSKTISSINESMSYTIWKHFKGF